MAGHENPTHENPTHENPTHENSTHGSADDSNAGEGLSVSPDHGTLPQLHPDIRDIRESIDNIDAALVHLLAERFKFTRRVGEVKAVTGMTAKDSAREEWQLNRLRGIAEASGLDPLFAEKFQAFITAEVIRHHHRIAGTDSEPDTVA